ncbi:hypothetical protein F5148DRAFT_1174511, partial [Russula earlei]
MLRRMWLRRRRAMLRRRLMILGLRRRLAIRMLRRRRAMLRWMAGNTGTKAEVAAMDADGSGPATTGDTETKTKAGETGEAGAAAVDWKRDNGRGRDDM